MQGFALALLCPSASLRLRPFGACKTASPNARNDFRLKTNSQQPKATRLDIKRGDQVPPKHGAATSWASKAPASHESTVRTRPEHGNGCTPFQDQRPPTDKPH